VGQVPSTATPPAVTPSSRPDSASAKSPVSQSFTHILTQHTSGFDEPAELAIRDEAALKSAWATLHNGIPGNAPPAVDFTREIVVLVAMGRRSSGGYTVHVDAVSRSGDGALVRYTATRPGDGCMSTQSLTSPVDVVRMARVSGAVRFERRETVQSC
jgi:hypothetical protein